MLHKNILFLPCMNFDILDNERKKILPFLQGNFSDFYLAGGTALALYFGHRKSIDFDFFSEKEFDASELFKSCLRIFKGEKIVQTQNEENTLSLIINDTVKISFFTFPYSLLNSLKKTEYFFIASIEDIAAMKCLAIVQRATQKDYIDMFFLLQKYSLSEILSFSSQKFPTLSSDVILKSMVYFEDIQFEKIEYIDNEYTWQEIISFLKDTVSKLIFK